MALTDIAIRRAKPREKPYKLFDEKGMYLLVSRAAESSGALNTGFPARKRRLPSDPIPNVRWWKPATSAMRLESSCATASIRAKSASARSATRKFGRSTPSGCSPTNGTKRSSPSGRRITPRALHGVSKSISSHHYGDRPVAEIEAPELLATLRTIEKRGSHDIAHRVLQSTARSTSDCPGPRESGPVARSQRSIGCPGKGASSRGVD